MSLLSFLSKLVERVVAKQLSKHLSACNLYVPVQSAYRPNHSTETALLKVVNDLLLAVDSGDAAVLALLDQSAAFDTIDHTILLIRLRCCFGLSGAAFSWFKSYLSGRRQSVSISGINSIAVSLLFGVPQGSVLGPVLFTLYNSPIHSITKKHQKKRVNEKQVTTFMPTMNRFTLPSLSPPTTLLNYWPTLKFQIV